MMALSKTIIPVSPDLDLDQYIDGMLSGFAWKGAPDNEPTITYSFPNEMSDYGSKYGSGEPRSNFEALNAALNPEQQQGPALSAQSAVDYMLQQFDSVIAWGFAKVPYLDVNDQFATIRYGLTDKTTSAWAYDPSENAEGGDVWFNNSKELYDAPIIGTNAWATVFLHETGHALGLKHPHVKVSGFGVVPHDHDSLEYTVMSYRSYVGDNTGGDYSNETFGYPQTLMMLDIAALQYMYGVEWTPNDDTRYTWSNTTGQEFINGVGQPIPGANRIFMTIWDGGGNDTLDFSNYTTNLLVDLQPGRWINTDTVNNFQTAHLDFYEDDIHLAAGNIALAMLPAFSNGQAVPLSQQLQALIENAIGGSGDDVFIGNQVNNVFTGNAGADHFVFNSSPSQNNIDTITDFISGVDIIDLDDSVFANLGSIGVLTADAFYVGVSAHDSTDRIVYDQKAGALYYDVDGSDPVAAVQFAQLDKHVTVAHSDFLIV
jgi:serralysin